MTGSEALAGTDRLDVCVGTSHCGGNCTVSGSVRPVAGASGARAMLWLALRRGSMKKASGAAPWLVIVTGTVTGLPAASLVPAASGSPAALTLTLLNWTWPVYRWEISSPPARSGHATQRGPVPGA